MLVMLRAKMRCQPGLQVQKTEEDMIVEWCQKVAISGTLSESISDEVGVGPQRVLRCAVQPGEEVQGELGG